MENQCYYRVGYYENGEWRDCVSNSGNIFMNIKSALRARNKQQRVYSFTKLEIGLYTFEGALDKNAIELHVKQYENHKSYIEELQGIFSREVYWNSEVYKNLPYDRAFRYWKKEYEKEQANENN